MVEKCHNATIKKGRNKVRYTNTRKETPGKILKSSIYKERLAAKCIKSKEQSKKEETSGSQTGPEKPQKASICATVGAAT